MQHVALTTLLILSRCHVDSSILERRKIHSIGRFQDSELPKFIPHKILLVKKFLYFHIVYLHTMVFKKRKEVHLSVASVTNQVGHVNPSRREKKKLQYEMYAFFPFFPSAQVTGDRSVVHRNFTGFFVRFVVSSFERSILMRSVGNTECFCTV